MSIHTSNSLLMEKVHKFVFLLGFIIMHIILLGNAVADESSDVKGIIGAILDSNSRIGQEQAVAIKMTLEDFYHYSNQSFTLYIRNSPMDPLQTALAGILFFVSLIYLENLIKA